MADQLSGPILSIVEAAGLFRLGLLRIEGALEPVVDAHETRFNEGKRLGHENRRDILLRIDPTMRV